MRNGQKKTMMIEEDEEIHLNKTNRPMTKEEKKLVDNQKFVGVVEDLGISVHRIKDMALTRIEILGTQYNQKKLFTSTFLCLKDNDVDKLITLLNRSKSF